MIKKSKHREKTVGDLANKDGLSEEDIRKHTRSEMPVQLEVTDLSKEQNGKVKALCQDFFASQTVELGKAVGVK